MFLAFLAQAATNATSAAAPGAPVDPATQAGAPLWTSVLLYGVMALGLYFLFIRPQSLAKKKQEATIKGARTGDRVITSSGIHGIISNVKDTTVIMKVADNVKLEIEKTHIDKITRPAPGGDVEKDAVVVKA